ncbi:MAG TPA: hypothetical protein P5063_02765 [Methanomassiliicoccales archaeon]|nr:hypothetical protein [Methanomassiliicoccales archaeon]
MGFGESYQGMSEREILIEVAMRMDVLEDKVDMIQCPSPRCMEHEQRLNVLETTERNVKDSKASVIAWIGVIAATIAVGVSILAIILEV